MKKRFLVSLLCVATATTMLVGCSGGETTETTAAATTAAATEAATTAAAETEADAETTEAAETEAPAEEAASGEGLVIGANIYSGADNFMNGVVKPALESAAAESGAEITIADSQGDQATLNNQIDTFITQGVDVLAINLVDPAAAGEVISKAQTAEIPLILFNKEATDGSMTSYDKVWYVGTNSAESGIIQGEMMAADLEANPEWDKNGDGVIQYVMLKGEAGHPDAEARTEWSVKTIVDAGIEVEELAMQPSATWSTADGEANMSGWLTQFGDEIELVISNNDGMAFGAAAAMEKASVSIPLYGVDALSEALTMIEAGSMQGTVLNDGVNQAVATVELAVNAALGNDVVAGTDWVIENDETKAVRVPYVGVTVENVADFK